MSEKRYSFLFLFFLCWEALMKESEFQHKLISTLKTRFPGCIVLKTDATYIQGFPDILILYKNRWAALECKRSSKASRRPNQDYYVNRLNEMSFAAFVSPENKKEVMDELYKALES